MRQPERRKRQARRRRAPAEYRARVMAAGEEGREGGVEERVVCRTQAHKPRKRRRAKAARRRHD